DRRPHRRRGFAGFASPALTIRCNSENLSPGTTAAARFRQRPGSIAVPQGDGYRSWYAYCLRGVRVQGDTMIRAILDRLYRFSGYLAGLFLIAIFVLMMLLSAGRLLGINIPAGDDFISWCMAATAFLGLAHTFKHGEMIRVGFLIDRLNDKFRHY